MIFFCKWRSSRIHGGRSEVSKPGRSNFRTWSRARGDRSTILRFSVRIFEVWNSKGTWIFFKMTMQAHIQSLDGMHGWNQPLHYLGCCIPFPFEDADPSKSLALLEVPNINWVKCWIASECNNVLNPMRARYFLISLHHPGKFLIIYYFWYSSKRIIP